MSRVVFVARHGETDWNATHRWQGHTDVPLNDTGRTQAAALAERLRGEVLAGAVASDLSRASETARMVTEALAVPLVYLDPDLRERAYGVFEGLDRSACETRQPEAWAAWLERREPPPGAESDEALRTRVVAAVERVAERVARDDAAALVVTHGGALRALVAATTGTMPPLVRNGAVWCVTWAGRIVGARELHSAST
jgi:broad specificity phosphatase PhoE